MHMFSASMTVSMIQSFRFSPADRAPLRIGILLDSPKLSGFFAKIIEDIQDSNFAAINLLVFRKRAADSSPKPQPRSRTGALAHRLLTPTLRKRALYDAYLRFEKRMKPAHHPLDTVDCSLRLAGIVNLEIEPIGKKFIHRFSPEALEQIRASALDGILRVGFNILAGAIFQAGRERIL